MNTKILAPAWFALLLVLGACTQTVDPTADIPVVSFQRDVSPIISGNCTASGCHGAENTADFTLLTYDDVIQHTDVKAGDAYGSKLFQVIREYYGESAMPPKPNQPLSDEQIGAVYVWILQGAKNN